MLVLDARAEFQGTYGFFRSGTDALMVHHAASLYPQPTALEDVRAVARYHTIDKGWPGIGYHEALAEARNGGEIVCYQLSNPNLQRAHVLNLNHQYFGIACLTNFNLHPGGVPEQKWIDALAERLRYWRTVYGNIPIVGHKERTVPGGETDCPGRTWYQWKPKLLDLVARGGVAAPVGGRVRTFRVTVADGVNVRADRLYTSTKVGAYGAGAAVLVSAVRRDNRSVVGARVGSHPDLWGQVAPGAHGAGGFVYLPFTQEVK